MSWVEQRFALHSGAVTECQVDTPFASYSKSLALIALKVDCKFVVNLFNAQRLRTNHGLRL